MSEPTTHTLLGTLYPFPRLPKEIRDQVWRLAASEPRDLDIQPHYAIVGELHNMFQYVSTPVPKPAILDACYESRACALNFYVKAFSIGPASRFIWANFDMDTIHIHERNLIIVSESERASIKKLVLELRDDEAQGFYELTYYKIFRAMKELRSLVILSDRKLLDWGDYIHQIREDFEVWFGSSDGVERIDPDIRIIEKETGLEMNFRNYDEIFEEVGKAAKDQAFLKRYRQFRAGT